MISVWLDWFWFDRFVGKSVFSLDKFPGFQKSKWGYRDNILVLHITRTFLAEWGGNSFETGKNTPIALPGADTAQSGFDRYCMLAYLPNALQNHLGRCKPWALWGSPLWNLGSSSKLQNLPLPRLLHTADNSFKTRFIDEQPFGQCSSLIPATVDIILAKVDPIPASVDLIPVYFDLIPASVDLIPAGVDLIPVTVDLIPGSVDLIPASVDLIPASVDLIPDECWSYSSECWSYSRECWSYSIECWSYSIECWSYSSECWSYSDRVLILFQMSVDLIPASVDLIPDECWSYSSECWSYSSECWSYSRWVLILFQGVLILFR